MTADEILDEARDHHPSFNTRNVPPKAALRALSRYVQYLTGRVLEMGEDALAEPVLVTREDLVDAVEGRTGITLPPHMGVMRSIHTWKGADTPSGILSLTPGQPGMLIPVKSVDYAHRYSIGAHHFPAVSVFGQKLYPLNLMDAISYTYTKHGWEDYMGLQIVLVPMPAQLTALSDEVQIPEVARPALVMHLAVWMAGRQGAAVVKDLPLLPQQALEAEGMAIRTLAGQDSAVAWHITD